MAWFPDRWQYSYYSQLCNSPQFNYKKKTLGKLEPSILVDE